MLQRAVKNGTLARNVASVHKPPAVEEKEIKILNAKEISNVLLRLDALFPIVSLALSTGMRRANFSMTLRTYMPGKAVVAQTWPPPPVVAVK